MDARLRAIAESAKGFMPVEEGLVLHDVALAAARARPRLPMLEVGTYCGKSAVYLGAACQAVDPPTVLFTVDHHRGSEENQSGWEHHDPTLIDSSTGRLNTLPTFLRTMRDADLEGTVVGVVGLSPIVASHWETPLAFLFIDGGHGVEPARADYASWTPKLVSGGTLAIHDVFPDPADGGRPPYEEIYLPALASGFFEETDAVGSLRGPAPRVTGRRCAPLARLHQLEPVAERVVDVDAVVALERLVVAGHVPRGRERRDERVEVVDDERRVGFASGTEVGVDAEVDLHRLGLEPAPAPYGEVRWLRQLRDAEQAVIERDCLGFATRRHRELDVIEPHHRHTSSIQVFAHCRSSAEFRPDVTRLFTREPRVGVSR